MTRTTLSTCFALTILLIGCAKEEADGPALPPVSTLQAELGTVGDAPAIAKNASLAEDTGVYTHFANAWARVAILRIYATGVILIPAAAMAAALLQKPVETDAGWQWNVAAQNWSGQLDVAASAAGWDLEMRVTNEAVTDYLWVEGAFALDLSEGSWLLHHPDEPATSDQVLAIHWSRLADDDRSLRYENVNQQSTELGDELAYTLLGTAAAVEFTDADDAGVVAEIHWDTVTGTGSIQVPGYNGGERACWDTAFQNTEC